MFWTNRSARSQQIDTPKKTCIPLNPHAVMKKEKIISLLRNYAAPIRASILSGAFIPRHKHVTAALTVFKARISGVAMHPKNANIGNQD